MTELLAATNPHEGASPPSPPLCLFCRAPLRHTFVDLGKSPLCESFLAADQLNGMEPFYPLHVRVCSECFLVQLEVYVQPEGIFTEYAYFSSYSTTWLEHARTYVETITERLKLDAASQVVEVASNDGYLLQYFVKKGIPVLGVEPAANVAAAAEEKGVRTAVVFFNEQTARDLANDGTRADLLIGNNVLAQVPDLSSFVQGMKILLAENGVITVEFPHLMRLMSENQFDTIYHEHFSYFSFTTASSIFAAHGLTVFDVDELPTHGGSLRLYIRHEEDESKPVTEQARRLFRHEAEAGVATLGHYASFQERVQRTKRRLLAFLIETRDQGKSVVGYGAPGKGNTMLNYCGIRTDFIEYTVDRNPYKHGRFLPGTHIPVHPPERIGQTCPDYVLILPWNLKEEIMDQLSYIRSWGGRFVVPIPEVRTYT